MAVGVKTAAAAAAAAAAMLVVGVNAPSTSYIGTVGVYCGSSGSSKMASSLLSILALKTRHHVLSGMPAKHSVRLAHRVCCRCLSQ
jgi:hypothetical protein